MRRGGARENPRPPAPERVEQLDNTTHCTRDSLEFAGAISVSGLGVDTPGELHHPTPVIRRWSKKFKKNCTVASLDPVAAWPERLLVCALASQLRVPSYALPVAAGRLAHTVPGLLTGYEGDGARLGDPHTAGDPEPPRG